ncbi:hypothetical protein DPMN_032024 [Dreissena polymorpha]|uniref:Uncharacterized protein n=1 Tax=Dreissena polymorpha TaxID=45954 RepID=A0A9D4M2Z6_DREPO|nr:hypothetical protein DPMN_032024 [Dreissena polymorpha]
MTSSAGIPNNGSGSVVAGGKVLGRESRNFHTSSSQCVEHVGSVAEPPSDVIDV